MKIQNPSEYIANKSKRENTPFRIKQGLGFYLCDGKLVPAKEFESWHPIGQVIRYIKNPKGDNSDRRKNWMHDERSY